VLVSCYFIYCDVMYCYIMYICLRRLSCFIGSFLMMSHRKVEFLHGPQDPMVNQLDIVAIKSHGYTLPTNRETLTIPSKVMAILSSFGNGIFKHAIE